MAHYFDTSALVKLVVAEAETSALQNWLAAAPIDPVASDLSRTELLRAVRRGAPDRLVRAREVLASLNLLSLTSEVFEEAARLEPDTLRSLDAIHLAAALTLGDELDGVVSYDTRLSEAATTLGIAVVMPT